MNFPFRRPVDFPAFFEEIRKHSPFIFPNVISNPNEVSGEKSQEIYPPDPSRGRNGNINVTLKVYDILGREVATLVNQNQAPGNYSIKFDASKLSSGIYFYKLQSGSFAVTKKMILMK